MSDKKQDTTKPDAPKALTRAEKEHLKAATERAWDKVEKQKGATPKGFKEV